MTTTDPKTAGELARFDVLRAAASEENSDSAVDQATKAAVERLLAEHGAAGIVGLVAELAHEALTVYRHQAVAQHNEHLSPLLDMIDNLGARAVSGTLLSVRHWTATDEESGETTPFTRVRLAVAGRSVKVDVPSADLLT